MSIRHPPSTALRDVFAGLRGAWAAPRRGAGYSSGGRSLPHCAGRHSSYRSALHSAAAQRPGAHWRRQPDAAGRHPSAAPALRAFAVRRPLSAAQRTLIRTVPRQASAARQASIRTVLRQASAARRALIRTVPRQASAAQRALLRTFPRQASAAQRVPPYSFGPVVRPDRAEPELQRPELPVRQRRMRAARRPPFRGRLVRVAWPTPPERRLRFQFVRPAPPKRRPYCGATDGDAGVAGSEHHAPHPRVGAPAGSPFSFHFPSPCLIFS